MSPPEASALSSCLLADWLVVGPDSTTSLQRIERERERVRSQRDRESIGSQRDIESKKSER